MVHARRLSENKVIDTLPKGVFFHKGQQIHSLANLAHSCWIIELADTNCAWSYKAV